MCPYPLGACYVKLCFDVNCTRLDLNESARNQGRFGNGTDARVSFFGGGGGLVVRIFTRERTSGQAGLWSCVFVIFSRGGPRRMRIEEGMGEIGRHKGSADAHVSASLSALFFFVRNIM